MTAPGTVLLDTTIDFGDGFVVFNQTDADGVEWFGDFNEGYYEAPGDRLSMSERSAGAGSFDNLSYPMARTIVIEGAVLAPTRELADRALTRFNRIFSGGALVPLVVTEPAGAFRLLVRKAAKADVKRINATQWTFQLSVIAPDPVKYGAVLQVASTPLAQDAPGGIQWNGPAGTTGISWANPGVAYQSDNGVTGVLLLTNLGDQPAPVRFTVTGPVTAPSIVDVTDDHTITYPGSVPAGSQLIVDTGTEYVALDGANRRTQLTSADFFTIPPTSTIEVAFRATSPSSSALLSASWRHASS